MADDKISARAALHLVLNDFRPDYRVLKETVALTQNGWQTSVFAMGGRGLPPRELVDGVSVSRMPIRSWVLKLGIAGLALKYVECACRMIWRGWRMKPNVVHAHDLNALPLGWLISRLTGAALIYDSHEYWADGSHRRNFSVLLFNAALIMEKPLAGRAKGVIAVSDGIADLLQERLKLSRRPAVVRNIPERAREENPFDLRAEFNLSRNATIFVFIGGIAPHRGVESILSALPHLPPETYLIFVGSASLPAWIIPRLPEGMNAKLRFKPPVPPREVSLWVSGADIGLVATEKSGLSHIHSLPNKLFEYIQAGLAVIVSDLPEMSRVAREYRCGRIFPSGDASALAAVMSGLASHPDELARLKSAAREAGRELVWEKEREKLVSLYGTTGLPQ